MSANIIKDEIETTKTDRKYYSSTNQSHYCWQKYNEYVLCLKKSSGDDEACKLSRAYAKAICPDEWVSQWDDERANGKFLGVQEKPIAKGHH